MAGGRQPGGLVGSARGFSLVELVIVMAIIATIAAIAIPRYGAAIARYRADMAARRVAADLGLARAKAREASQSRTVTFDVAGSQVRILGVADLARPASEYLTRLGDAPYHATLVSADFGGDPQVIFSGYGMPDSSGSVLVQVGDIQKTILLDPVTGKATVQ